MPKIFSPIVAAAISLCCSCTHIHRDYETAMITIASDFDCTYEIHFMPGEKKPGKTNP